MVTTISKWGNGQAVRLSKDVMERAKWCVNDTVSVEVEGNTVVLRHIPQTKSERFDQMIKEWGGNTENLRTHEIDWGGDIGKEVVE